MVCDHRVQFPLLMRVVGVMAPADRATEFLHHTPRYLMFQKQSIIIRWGMP